MPLFRVKGKLAETKNPRNRQYLAKTEVEARSKAEAEGILVSSVEEIPPQPPTEKQLAYAFDLGIAIPDNVTKDEISDLISMKTSNDRPSTDRHRRFSSSVVQTMLLLILHLIQRLLRLLIPWLRMIKLLPP